MTKIFKKIAASVMAVSTLALGAAGMTASASTEDTNIKDFIAPPSAAGIYNPVPVNKNGIRVKSTDSSVYVNITSSKYNVSVQTWGLSDTKWSGGKNLTCNSAGSTTTAVTLSSGRRYQIKNLINERGYNCAGLKMRSTSQNNSSTVQGKWSPDYSPENGVILAN
ncbi:MAG: hypothetical protein NC320_07315 [Clostridium sp.]|nr:hypothetical protein [Clostridium sp.]